MKKEATLIGEIDSNTLDDFIADARKHYTVSDWDLTKAITYVYCSCEDNDSSVITVADYLRRLHCFLEEFHECPTEETAAWD